MDNLVVLAIFMVIIYICLYALVDRICRCVENCAMAKGYSKVVEASTKNKEENKLD